MALTELNLNETTKLSEKMISRTSGSGTFDGVARKLEIKTKSVKSYITFLHETNFVCCGVLHTYYRAIAVTSCALKLRSCGFENVISVIGLSHGHNSQDLRISDVNPLLTQQGLSLVVVSMFTQNLKHQ